VEVEREGVKCKIRRSGWLLFCQFEIFFGPKFVHEIHMRVYTKFTKIHVFKCIFSIIVRYFLKIFFI
jgi:hypothetical protein